MTLPEAIHVVQRFSAWYGCRDGRAIEDAFPDAEQYKALAIVSALGTVNTEQVVNCFVCNYFSKTHRCLLGVKGECKEFERASDDV